MNRRDATPIAGNSLFTTAKAAEYLHLSSRTLIRWRNQRTGPAWTKLGYKVVYQERDIEAWLKARRVEAVA